MLSHAICCPTPRRFTRSGPSAGRRSPPRPAGISRSRPVCRPEHGVPRRLDIIWLNVSMPPSELLPHSTTIMGIPTYYTRLLAAPAFAKILQNPRLLISGSAPLLPETHPQFERTGRHILERYGMTETGMIASNPFAARAHGRFRRLCLARHRLRIAEPDGRVLRPAKSACWRSMDQTYLRAIGGDPGARISAAMDTSSPAISAPSMPQAASLLSAAPRMSSSPAVSTSTPRSREGD